MKSRALLIALLVGIASATPVLAGREEAAATPPEPPAAAAAVPAVPDAAPKPLATPPAKYPPRLARDCLGGRVGFSFTIAEDGRVADVVITSSTNDALNGVVAAHLKREWRFTPYSIAALGKAATYSSYMVFVPTC